MKRMNLSELTENKFLHSQFIIWDYRIIPRKASIKKSISIKPRKWVFWRSTQKKTRANEIVILKTI